jgi:hypothetical protein
VQPIRVHFDVHACLAAAPFRSPGPNPSSSGWGLPRRTTRARVGVPCGSPSEPGKMYLASLCNRSTTRAPTDRSIPERRAFAELTAGRIDTCSERPRGVLLPCGKSTPGGRALDGTHPTSAKPTTTLPNGKSRAPHRAMPPRRSVFNRVQGCSIWPLTLLVLPRRIRKPKPAKQQEPFPSLPRQRERPSRPEVPSINKCSRRNPPPCSRLSHRRAGFQHSFASRMLAHIEARPSTDPQVLHPQARWPRAACQLLQPKRSTTTTAGTARPRALRLRCDPQTLRCLGG